MYASGICPIARLDHLIRRILEVPDSFSFAVIVSFSRGLRSLAGIGNSTEPGYVNPTGKDFLASGRSIIGENGAADVVCEDVLYPKIGVD